MTAVGMQFDPRTGIVTMLSSDREQAVVERGTLETTYERPKGPKVVQRVGIDTARPSVDLTMSILRFDTIFALDTNSRQISGTPSAA